MLTPLRPTKKPRKPGGASSAEYVGAFERLVRVRAGTNGYYILTARKPQLPQPAMKRATMNMVTFCAPHNRAPPMMEKKEQYHTPAFRPQRSIM